MTCPTFSMEGLVTVSTRRTIVAAVVLLMSATTAHAQAPADTFAEVPRLIKVGETVVATTGAGETVRGRVQEISETRLILRRGPRDTSLSADDVQRVAYPTHAVRNGMLIGLAVGFTIGAVGAATSDCGINGIICLNNPGGVLALGGFIGGIGLGAGAAIGAIARREHVIFDRPRHVSTSLVPFVNRAGAGVRVALAF
jgi:hypothetical protein